MSNPEGQAQGGVVDVHQEIDKLQQNIQDQKKQIDQLTEKQALGDVIHDLKSQYATQLSTSIVEKFKGNPKKFSTWIKSVEKAAALAYSVPNSRQLAHICLVTSTGPVSDFLLRYIAKEQQYDWHELVRQLKDRFGCHTDIYSAILDLRKIKQKPNQTPHAYAEYLNYKAREAYSEGELQTQLVQRELVSIFCSGLDNKKVAIHILRKGPVTLENAVQIANEELLISSRVQAHGLYESATVRREEPMEVDVVKATSTVNQQLKSQTYQRGQQFVKKTGSCYRCGKEGHWKSTCKVKLVTPNPCMQKLQEKPKFQGKCYFCQKPGHKVAECFRKKREEGHRLKPNKTQPNRVATIKNEVSDDLN